MYKVIIYIYKVRFNLKMCPLWEIYMIYIIYLIYIQYIQNI